jgi:predicted MFS family arabinose efflux permease
MLLIARTLMAAGGALTTPVAMAVGAASVEPAQRGKALAVVYTGFTLAQVLSIPAGAWLGYAFGWRWAFGILAVLSLIAAVVLYVRVPRGLAVPPTSLKILGRLLTTARPVWAVMFTALFLSALFCLYTFLAPFVEQRHGLGRTGVTAMLLLFGVAGVLGNAMGGFLTDRIGSVRTLAALCIAQIIIMPFLTLTYLPLIATGVVIALWSLSSWSVHVPQQARLAALDPQHAPVLLALHAGGLYVGGSVGSAIGGLALERWGVDALGPTGAIFAVLALASLVIVARLPGGARHG